MNQPQAVPENAFVVALGDYDTVRLPGELAMMAAQHGATIAEFHSFEPGEVASQNDLAASEAVIAALGTAIAHRIDLWVPNPRADLVREEHLRRLGLVLQRHGVNLLLGPHLVPCPTNAGLNEIDFALRIEVQAVDSLDRAVIAAAGIRTLEMEIEAAFCAESKEIPHEVRYELEVLAALQQDNGPAPHLPTPTTPRKDGVAMLKRYVKWLVDECGTSRSLAAQILNCLGQRTPANRLWQRGTISALLGGRYDHRVAA